MINLDDIHVVGHSLGAHIAGNVGRYFNGKLGRFVLELKKVLWC